MFVTFRPKLINYLSKSSKIFIKKYSEILIQLRFPVYYLMIQSVMSLRFV